MENKSKVISALLAFFLGPTGAHRYYLGYKKKGIIQTCGFVSIIIGYVMYIVAISARYPDEGVLIVSALFLICGAGVCIWAFVDFIRILIGRLTPADGSAYTENQLHKLIGVTSRVNVDALDKLINVIEKLAKLHEQGVLTDEEFQQKKTELLAKM